MMNAAKTAFLLALMTAIVIWIGSLFGTQGLIIAGAAGLLMNVGSYWFSDKVVLKMYRAREVSPSEAPGLHSIIDRLSVNANLPKPKVCIVPSQAPNAFATGRNPKHAVVAVTEGAMNMLRPAELEGVLAHELAHVADRDMLISTIAAVLAGAIMMFAMIIRWSFFLGGIGGGRDERGGNPLALLAVALIAPLAATLIRLAVSRSREFEADAKGARIAGSPDGLADALETLQRGSQRYRMNAGEATAHLFIVNPLSGKSMASLFSTHPPTEERIRRLRNMRI